MNSRSAGGSGNLGRNLAVVAVVLLALCASTLGGQFMGSAIFAKLEKLPPSIAGITTLYEYWMAFGTVNHVRRALAFSSFVAGLVALAPLIILLAVFIISKQRSLHGDARFATVREIRESGLVEKQ
ncbi:hypothetical protein [Paraburkholderia largidicola]|uniref:Uncharacterized protein n=1 Tax=Paraburkholderia largidicola TaxID=3014751 RepID=A0A7I8C6N9_9BURK|nr:hypothetical protein [Paraburkholderia sp. PGU16]BCF95420.1 hypothetical protein PPGU16_84870 [Paraburkholderia sp. PGU16]